MPLNYWFVGRISLAADEAEELRARPPARPPAAAAPASTPLYAGGDGERAEKHVCVVVQGRPWHVMWRQAGETFGRTCQQNGSRLDGLARRDGPRSCVRGGDGARAE